MRRKAIITATLIAIVMLYCGTYALSRSHHYLIHTEKAGTHEVRRGDMGWDMMGNPHPKLATASFYVFTPLRWIETLYWDVRA